MLATPLETATLPPGIRSRFVRGVNGLDIHILEAGYAPAGRPLVLLLHGFPEIAYSWRKVMPALAEAGFHAVAPDQRGYGRTTGWSPDFDTDLRPWRTLNAVRDALGLDFAVHLPAPMHEKHVVRAERTVRGQFLAPMPVRLLPRQEMLLRGTDRRPEFLILRRNRHQRSPDQRDDICGGGRRSGAGRHVSGNLDMRYARNAQNKEGHGEGRDVAPTTVATERR